MKTAEVDFNSLVDEHGSMVFNLAFRITGNRQDAEDVVQETFLQVFKGLQDFRGDSSLSTWIYRIAVNSSLKVKRMFDRAYLDSLDEKIEIFKDDIPAEVRGWFDDPAETAHLQALLTEINEGCLHFMSFRLTDEQRVVYIMFYVLEFTHAEMAGVLRISENVVKARLHRARVQLGKYFQGRCERLGACGRGSCTCKSRVGFALAFDPELMTRVRTKALKTRADAALGEYLMRQVDDISELYRGLPLLEHKAEQAKSHLSDLQRIV
jgi:RNA polymerase sigma factor (sigma-70 family)